MTRKWIAMGLLTLVLTLSMGIALAAPGDNVTLTVLVGTAEVHKLYTPGAAEIVEPADSDIGYHITAENITFTNSRVGVFERHVNEYGDNDPNALDENGRRLAKYRYTVTLNVVGFIPTPIPTPTPTPAPTPTPVPITYTMFVSATDINIGEKAYVTIKDSNNVTVTNDFSVFINPTDSAKVSLAKDASNNRVHVNGLAAGTVTLYASKALTDLSKTLIIYNPTVPELVVTPQKNNLTVGEQVHVTIKTTTAATLTNISMYTYDYKSTVVQCISTSSGHSIKATGVGTSTVYVEALVNGVKKTQWFNVAVSSVQPTPPPTPVKTATVVTPNKGGLNLRETTSLNARVLVVIPKHATVSVLQHGSTWSYVRYGWYEGYVMSSYLSFGHVPTPTPIEIGKAQVLTVSGSLNLRQTASLSAKVLLRIPRLAWVSVYEWGNTWSYVGYNGYVGHVMTQYITRQNPTPQPTPNPVGGRLAYVNVPSGALNLRETPSDTSRIYTSIPNYAMINVHEVGATWSHVSYNGWYGYVLTQYITLLS